MNIIQSNHITHNILTRGNMNTSALTKGFIVPSFKYEIITPINRYGGGGADAFYDEIEQLRKRKEDIEYINIYVNWDKTIYKYGKSVTVDLIQKKISAELVSKFDSKYNINVNLIE